MQWTFVGQKKPSAFILDDECRFLSDKRPAHAFYEFKTPDTIAAVGSHYEQNPQVAIPYFVRKVLVVVFVAAFSLLSAVQASAASLSVGPGATLSRTK